MATTIRYSEAFKLEVIDSLANSKYKTIADAKRAFGITGCGTVERWLAKYGLENFTSRSGWSRHLGNRILARESENWLL